MSVRSTIEWILNKASSPEEDFRFAFIPALPIGNWLPEAASFTPPGQLNGLNQGGLVTIDARDLQTLTVHEANRFYGSVLPCECAGVALAEGKWRGDNDLFECWNTLFSRGLRFDEVEALLVKLTEERGLPVTLMRFSEEGANTDQVTLLRRTRQVLTKLMDGRRVVSRQSE